MVFCFRVCVSGLDDNPNFAVFLQLHVVFREAAPLHGAPVPWTARDHLRRRVPDSVRSVPAAERREHARSDGGFKRLTKETVSQ